MREEGWDIILARRRLNFNDASTRAYFMERPPLVGDDLILHMTHYDTNRYRLDKVAALLNTADGKLSKIVLENGCLYDGISYWISGNSSCYPTEQTHLIPLVLPIAALLNHDTDTDLSDDQLWEILRS